MELLNRVHIIQQCPGLHLPLIFSLTIHQLFKIQPHFSPFYSYMYLAPFNSIIIFTEENYMLDTGVDIQWWPEEVKIAALMKHILVREDRWQTNLYITLKNEGFPGGPMVKNLPCNAEDTSSIPGQGTKIPRTAEYLSSHTVTRESLLLNKQKEIPHIASKTWCSQNKVTSYLINF